MIPTRAGYEWNVRQAKPLSPWICPIRLNTSSVSLVLDTHVFFLAPATCMHTPVVPTRLMSVSGQPIPWAGTLFGEFEVLESGRSEMSGVVRVRSPSKCCS